MWWLLLQRIQSARRFLSSLETFHLKIRLTPFDEKPEAIFNLLLENQGLLNYVTHVTFYGDLDFRYYGDQVKSILVSCPKLLGVSFPIQKRGLMMKPKHATCLKVASFESLHNVTMLRLQVDDFLSLTEHFQFPPRLESLFLKFNCQDWDDKNAISFFEKFK